MQRSELCDVVAIASRDISKARAAADSLGIARAYGSYEELLADPDIEAVYIPLPNHLHVPWTIAAAEAGKHVLCEKPIALNAEEARTLLAVRERTGVQIAEAFMVRTHPQWLAVRVLVRSGSIGELRLISGQFSYFKIDPNDVRNKAEWGGGGLMDIGCYLVMIARWLFDAEPLEVKAFMELDPVFGVDRLTSWIMRFEKGQAHFACGTQLVPYQRVQICGTERRIEVEKPFVIGPDEPTRVLIDSGGLEGRVDVIDIAAADQFALQGDAFSRAVRGAGITPMVLEDSIANMAVLDALRAAPFGTAL
jgi:predicted dehydrogenase